MRDELAEEHHHQHHTTMTTPPHVRLMRMQFVVVPPLPYSRTCTNVRGSNRLAIQRQRHKPLIAEQQTSTRSTFPQTQAPTRRLHPVQSYDEFVTSVVGCITKQHLDGKQVKDLPKKHNTTTSKSMTSNCGNWYKLPWRILPITTTTTMIHFLPEEEIKTLVRQAFSRTTAPRQGVISMLLVATTKRRRPSFVWSRKTHSIYLAFECGSSRSYIADDVDDVDVDKESAITTLASSFKSWQELQMVLCQMKLDMSNISSALLPPLDGNSSPVTMIPWNIRWINWFWNLPIKRN